MSFLLLLLLNFSLEFGRLSDRIPLKAILIAVVAMAYLSPYIQSPDPHFHFIITASYHHVASCVTMSNLSMFSWTTKPDQKIDGMIIISINSNFSFVMVLG